MLMPTPSDDGLQNCHRPLRVCLLRFHCGDVDLLTLRDTKQCENSSFQMMKETE